MSVNLSRACLVFSRGGSSKATSWDSGCGVGALKCKTLTLVVLMDDRFRIPSDNQLTLTKQRSCVTKLNHKLRVMGNQDNRAPLGGKLFDTRQALTLEGLISNRKNFIQYQHIWLAHGQSGKSNPGIHTAGIGFYRPIKKGAHICKGFNVRQSRLSGRIIDAQQGTGNQNVVATAEFRIEAGT